MTKDCKQPWWKEAKYGMFIHWGLYSHIAGDWNGETTTGSSEWIMKNMNIPVEEYAAKAKEFNPVRFDAAEVVGLAREAGMKYIVITAKHHDGFAMYRSSCSSFNIIDATPFGRDPLRELADACREAGMPLGFYYSQTQDWYEPDGFGYGPEPSEEQFARYLDNKCKPQLKELLTQYGDVALIWFDTPAMMSSEQSRELAQFVKQIQPQCIVSGRIGHEQGEYMSTGDNMIPALPYFGDWEVPATMNRAWGYKRAETNWKTPQEIIERLVKINSRGGNYLLNIGPDGTGVIPAVSRDILLRVGSWLRDHSDSIYVTQPVPVYPYELEWGMFTFKPGKLFMHVFHWGKLIKIPCLANKVTRAYVLKTGQELEFVQRYSPANQQYIVILYLPDSPPDEIDSVLCLQVEGESPQFDSLDTL